VNVGKAKSLARQWVIDEASRLPGFAGAYTAGSVNWCSDELPQPASSDVDVKVVLDVDPLPPNPGKFSYGEALLDVSLVPLEALRSVDDVLGHYHMAAALSRPSIVVDPTGYLAQLQQAVSRDYAQRHWVAHRLEHARLSVLNWIGGIQKTELYHDQVTCWLFSAAGMAHVVLVAALRNPTIRRRYQAAQRVLAEHGLSDYHESLLELMGCAHMDCGEVEGHLAAVTDVFDYASRIIKTPYRFAADISAIGRPVAIDGSREMIEQGFHREAMYWLVTTFSRCQAILVNDAPMEMREHFGRGYARLLEGVGIRGVEDLVRGGERIRDSLPRLMEVSGAIAAVNAEG